MKPLTHSGRRFLAAGRPWFLAGYRGLTRGACTFDPRQFTGWCRTRSLPHFSLRRADIETFAREMEGRGRARVTSRLSAGSVAPASCSGRTAGSGSGYSRRKHRDAWDRFVDLTGRQIERIEIPYEGTTLPGYFFRSGPAGRPRRTLIYNNGSITTAATAR